MTPERLREIEELYHAARDGQDRLGNHHVLPVAGPLPNDYVLWRFRLDQPKYVIGVEHAAGVPWAAPPSVLYNPGEQPRGHAAPGQPGDRLAVPGLPQSAPRPARRRRAQPSCSPRTV